MCQIRLLLNAYLRVDFQVEPHSIPVAIGFITTAQLGGAAIALAIANSVFLNEASNAISAILPNVAPAQIHAAISGAGSKFLQTYVPWELSLLLHLNN